MRAFVLSGGANYGALQVGALEVLLTEGIHPEMLVGVSAGALNAAWLARNPDLAGLQELAHIWINIAPRSISGFSLLRIAYRFLRGEDSLLSNNGLLQLLQDRLPPDSTFSEVQNPALYVVAARLLDGSLRVFGDDPDDRVLDGLMASTAVPPIYPPWKVNDRAYIDGGIVANLPIEVAIARGADEIFALQILYKTSITPSQEPRGLFQIAGQAINMMLNRQIQMDMEIQNSKPGVRIHTIQLQPRTDPGIWNYHHARELIEAGREAMTTYLSQQTLVA